MALAMASSSIARFPHPHPHCVRLSSSHRSPRPALHLYGLSKRWPSPISSAVSGGEQSIKPAITLTEKALKHLNKMRTDLNQDLCLRVGVRQGGCSGMSYTMDFEQRGNLQTDDSLIDYEGFTMVCDPKSLLFMYGMQLDYSNALIGGGFSFSNPNATSTCGCGKSFAA